MMLPFCKMFYVQSTGCSHLCFPKLGRFIQPSFCYRAGAQPKSVGQAGILLLFSEPLVQIIPTVKFSGISSFTVSLLPHAERYKMMQTDSTNPFHFLITSPPYPYLPIPLSFWYLQDRIQDTHIQDIQRHEPCQDYL